MKELLKRAGAAGLVLDIVQGELKLYSENGEVDQILLNEIKLYKEEIKDYLIKNEIGGIYGAEYKSIEPIPLDTSYRMSDAQRRLWILSQFEEGSLAYNIPNRIPLIGKHDIEKFKMAVTAVINRHEILRTVFKGNDSGEIRQWVLSTDELGFSIDFKDFRDEGDREGMVRTYIQQDSYLPFDLEKGPLLRASILQVGDEEIVFYYNMHHIISDEWSMEVLAKDVFAFYEGYVRGIEPDLKDLNIQYKDYSAWQLKQLEEDSFTSHRAYWLDNMSGELPLLNLPTSKARPRIKTFNGSTIFTSFDKEISNGLKKYSTEKEGSLFMGLLATWNVLMYRYTSQNDLIIGTPVAGRDHADLENQIGFYLNTLALRNQVKPEESFNDFFQRVKENTLKSYSHQMYPFDRLVDELSLMRDTSRSALFDVMLVLENDQKTSDEFDLDSEMESNLAHEESRTSKFDLLLSVHERGERLSLSAEFNTDVYDREMVEKLLVHYETLIGKLISHPDMAVAEVDYLSEDERLELLHTLNDTTVAYSDKTVMQLFEEQVERTPDQIAVEFEELSLTYADLNSRCNVLANLLKVDYGITRNSKVGIMLERSMESVISMIGVMKSGACYVPIDPDYPQERVAYIVKDSALETIVSNARLWEKHSIHNSTLLDIKSLDLSIGNTTNPLRTNDLEDGSYVIYTSGSTGKPKGVLQTHRMMSNLIQWDIHQSGIETGLKHLQYASFSFDASLHDIYFVLSSSGSVYIVNDSSRLDYQSLLYEIVQKEIVVLSMPYSALDALCLHFDSTTLERHSIRYIVSTAEQLYVNNSLEKFLENNPKVELHNHYGPSETHVVTSYKMSSEIGNIVRRSSIGQPISNTRIYILDTFRNLVPHGVFGEIYVGGDNLAVAYLNMEEETNQKFVDSPFGSEKLYKTGDIAYRRKDGNIEFIGRTDDQVKIRGYRIELGEIEQALSKIDAIESMVVLARENRSSENELVAYITAKEEQNIGNLRASLKESLPAYMIPAHFVQLETLPLTPNGKIDKKALPDPLGHGLDSGVEFIAPVNEIEQKLVDIWEMVLGRKGVSVRDDFFELGGYSFKAMGLIVEYKNSFNVALSLKDIYDRTHLYEHAELIEIKNWIKDESKEEPSEQVNLETFDF